MSFNKIKKLEGLDTLTKVQKLFVINNRISKIENIGHLRQLTMLELGSNGIRVSRFTFRPRGTSSLYSRRCHHRSCRRCHPLLPCQRGFCVGAATFPLGVLRQVDWPCVSGLLWTQMAKNTQIFRVLVVQCPEKGRAASNATAG